MTIARDIDRNDTTFLKNCLPNDTTIIWFHSDLFDFAGIMLEKYLTVDFLNVFLKTTRERCENGKINFLTNCVEDRGDD